MDRSALAAEVAGRLVLEDAVVAGRLVLDGPTIVAVTPDEAVADGPLVCPGFVDLHVHGWGGHDAMGGPDALSGMARALLAHGVTSFLPTAVTAPLDALAAFAAEVRRWMIDPPTDAAEPLGFDLEGPFINPVRKGAQNPAHIAVPAATPWSRVEPLLDGLRLTHVAPEVPGALDLIRELVGHGVRVALGHSQATVAEAEAGYAAGATSTTHLFNAMSAVDHHRPGLAVAALLDDAVHVELIADGHHVEPALWPLILRLKPADRVLLVSDALSIAGLGEGRIHVGGLAVEVRGEEARLVDGGNLAGSVIALDTAVRNLVRSGVPLPRAVAAASRVPLALLGVADRGRLAAGQRADLVELDDALRVRRVMKAGRWFAAA
ncbi:MAG TPA: amidohydrolase family protein [Candidatus Limnocylindrales bacterium]